MLIHISSNAFVPEGSGILLIRNKAATEYLFSVCIEAHDDPIRFVPNDVGIMFFRWTRGEPHHLFRSEDSSTQHPDETTVTHSEHFIEIAGRQCKGRDTGYCHNTELYTNDAPCQVFLVDRAVWESVEFHHHG